MKHQEHIPPMAAVSVTPITLDSNAVEPSAPKPPVRLGSQNRYPPEPMLARSRALFSACRPGNKSGAEFNVPCNFPYATREPLQ